MTAEVPPPFKAFASGLSVKCGLLAPFISVSLTGHLGVALLEGKGLTEIQPFVKNTLKLCIWNFAHSALPEPLFVGRKRNAVDNFGFPLDLFCGQAG